MKQFLADPLGRCFNELLARLEVLVGRTAIDSGTTRDLGNTQPFLAVLRKHLARGLQNGLAGSIRIAGPADAFLWRW